MTAWYQKYVRRMAPAGDIEFKTKLRIMDNELAAELETMSHRLVALARNGRHAQDITRNGLKRALRLLVGHLPVYRTYVDASGASESDRRNIEYAVSRFAVIPKVCSRR